MSSRRLLAVDPSLTCSGWALFCAKSEKLLGVGKLKALGPERRMSERLKDFQDQVSALYTNISLSEDDIVVCESPTTVRDPRAAFLVEQVRCIFEVLARGRGASVPGRVNPRSVHNEIMGLRGRQIPREQVKGVAARLADSLYRDSLLKLGFPLEKRSLSAHQDIADALLIGNLAVTWAKEAVRVGISVEESFEMRVGKVSRRRKMPLSAVPLRDR